MKRIKKIFQKKGGPKELDIISFDQLMEFISSEEVEVEVRENKINVVINGKTHYYSTKDLYDQSHLANAVEGHDIQEVGLFLELGFDVNEIGYMGDTAIFKVFSTVNYFNKYSISKLLLDYGANPFIANNNGDSAIDYFQHYYPYKEGDDNSLRELIREYYGDFFVEDYNNYPLPCFDEFNRGLAGNVGLIDNSGDFS